MRTLLFSFILSCGLLTNAQEGLKIGVSGGLPIGDQSEFFTVQLQGNLDYLFHISREIHIGVTTGYSRYLGNESSGVEDFVYLPLGATSQFHVSEKVKLGADVGYALVLEPDESEGGFFYVPKVQYSLSENTDLVLAYRGLGISDVSLGSISLGFEFGFF